MPHTIFFVYLEWTHKTKKYNTGNCIQKSVLKVSRSRNQGLLLWLNRERLTRIQMESFFETRGEWVMNMKYFRFLFEETNGCFIHFAELTKADTEERVCALYLRSIEEKDASADVVTDFVCPAHVDLVILGRSDAAARNVWQRLSEQTEADVLVFAGEDSGKKLKAKQIICLSAQTPQWEFQKMGWKIFLKTYEENAVVVMHGFDENRAGERAEDCVMNIKTANRHRRCYTQPQPDGYGCTLGCVLHQDYDVCKYQAEGQARELLTGTVLLTGATDSKVRGQIWKDMEQQPWTLRFLALPEETQRASLLEQSGIWNMSAEQEYKTYCISMGKEIDAGFAKRVCEKGFYHVPIVLGKEQGLCCSGLVKYRENEACLNLQTEQ